MNTEEAKIELSIQLDVKRILRKEFQADALALGIEALTFYQSWWEGHCFQKSYLLPGETVEEEQPKWTYPAQPKPKPPYLPITNHATLPLLSLAALTISAAGPATVATAITSTFSAPYSHTVNLKGETMKLDKAIEIALDHYMDIPPHADPYLRPALNVLIQAAKRLDQIRLYDPSYFKLTLPGETD